MSIPDGVHIWYFKPIDYLI